MKPRWGVVLLLALVLFLFPVWGDGEGKKKHNLQLNNEIRAFLELKDSPLAPHTELLLQQSHWKLLIAISAIESQYCVRQISWNCWGIGGDSAYKHYESVPEAIVDANELITHWQSKGRWLTVEDMNCHYVVPCNPNWVATVNKVLKQLDAYERN